MKRVCLLTGASGLLGTAFIERYADRYHIVAVHHRNAVRFATQDQTFVDPLRPSREVAANSDAVRSIRADLSQSQEIDRVIDEVGSHFGQVDLLINGAACRGWAHLLAPGALDGVDALFKINVQAPLRLCVGMAKKFWTADPGGNINSNRNIVNVSSTAGLFVYPDVGQALYGASKAALNHLTYHLANDFWDIGIRVNAVAPDTFPARVSTEAVLETIIKLDASTQTGQVVPLHK